MDIQRYRDFYILFINLHLPKAQATYFRRGENDSTVKLTTVGFAIAITNNNKQSGANISFEYFL